MTPVTHERGAEAFHKFPNVGDTRESVDGVVTIVEQHRSRPTEATEVEELEMAGDLAD